MKKTLLKILCVLMAATVIVTTFGGCGKMKAETFANEYDIPEATKPYRTIDTAAKTDWSASWIWDSSEGSEENVWMSLRKTVDIERLPERLTASA